jgi:DNA-binding transcriptional ArsR family regulator
MQKRRAPEARTEGRLQESSQLTTKTLHWGSFGQYAATVEGFKIFGSPTRTRVVIIALALRETYPRELARISGVPLVTVQRIVEDLEREGILSTRLSGNQRRVIVNPEWFASKELRALALRLAEVVPDIRAALDAERRRARRRGKPVDRA